VNQRVPRLVCLGLLLALSSPAAAEEALRLRFALHSQPIAAVELASLRKSLPSRSVRVFEPYEQREVTFEALGFGALLDAIYPGLWRDQEELLFTCSDGYQPTLPVQRVLEHRAWLAFDRSDEPGFTIHKHESGETKRIGLAPFYLIWENLDDAQLLSEGDYGWPYQLVAIDVIRTRDHFAEMAPPESAPRNVLDGFAAFRVHCSRCHTINGQGGSIGPELNGPVPSVESRSRGWLERRIDDPSLVMEKARMPRLNPQLPERERVIDDLLAYLEAMAQAKPSPEPETAGGR